MTVQHQSQDHGVYISFYLPINQSRHTLGSPPILVDGKGHSFLSYPRLKEFFFSEFWRIAYLGPVKSYRFFFPQMGELSYAEYLSDGIHGS